MTQQKEWTTEDIDRIADAAYPRLLEEGLRTGPADLAEATACLTEIYAMVGEDAPEVRRCLSPHAAEAVAREHLGKPDGTYIGTWCWGSQDLYWLGWHEVAADELGVDYDPEDLTALRLRLRLARAADWVYMLPGLALVCDSPIRRPSLSDLPDGSPQLHREGGLAIEYADGYGVAALWDVTVPAWLACTPVEELDPAWVIGLENVDHRRVGIRRIGVASCLSALNAREIDRDTIVTHDLDADGRPTPASRTHPYVLHRLRLPGVDADSTALEMAYPSGPGAGAPVVEFVPPWITTCADARAWRAVGGNSEEEFDARRAQYTEPEVLT